MIHLGKIYIMNETVMVEQERESCETYENYAFLNLFTFYKNEIFFKNNNY